MNNNKDNKNGNDSDFLNNLYAQSLKKEAPPVDLDQKILMLAREKAPKRNVVSLFQWQRMLSVAAVMVLSLYIFFDVGEHSMKVENFTPQHENIRLKVPSFDQDYALPQSAPPIKAAKEKAQAKSVVQKSLSEQSIEASKDFKDLKRKSSSDSAKKQAIQSKRQKSEAASKATHHFSAPSIKQEIVEAVPDSIMAEAAPQLMIQEIQQLIADDKLLDAKKLYQQLSDLYPNYPIPVEIIKALDG